MHNFAGLLHQLETRGLIVQIEVRTQCDLVGHVEFGCSIGKLDLEIHLIPLQDHILVRESLMIHILVKLIVNTVLGVVRIQELLCLSAHTLLLRVMAEFRTGLQVYHIQHWGLQPLRIQG